MLNSRMKRRTADGARAITRLAQIEASVVALKDDDLLHLADIFVEQIQAPLLAMARSEMLKRNLSL